MDTTYLTLAEALGSLRRGSVSAADLAAQCIAAIESTEGAVKAWVSLDAESAMEQAERVDRKEITGRLAGIPFAVKDIIDVKGFATTASSRVLLDNVADEDAPVVAILQREGAVILGKTNTHEFAYGYVSPPTTNPWDPARIPGGSSGGSAAAVAAGHCLGALGSDTGGSIRVPAALCGVSGLKPATVPFPMQGVIPLSPRMDVVGPIARTVEDLEIIWTALGGKGAEEVPVSLGIPSDEVFGECEAEVLDRFHEACVVLAALVSETTPVALPAFEDFNLPRSALIMPDALDVHRKAGWWPGSADDYTEEIRDFMLFAENLPAEMIEAGQAEAARLSAELMAAFEAVTVIATPTVPCVAPTHLEAEAKEDGGPRRPVAMKLMRLPGPANMAGLAALSVPCGLGAHGMPVGLQLMAKEEGVLLSLGKRFQEVTDWHLLGPLSH